MRSNTRPFGVASGAVALLLGFRGVIVGLVAGAARGAAGGPRAAAPRRPGASRAGARLRRLSRRRLPRRRREALRGAVGKGLRNEDWALFLLGESEFYDGRLPRRARSASSGSARGHGRPAQMAPFRVADCLWMEGDRAQAAAKAYARLVKKATARDRRRRAGALSHRRGAADRDRGRRAQAVLGHRARLPGAPAGRRGAAPARRRHARDAATTPAPPRRRDAGGDAAAPDLAPGDRLRRAESLAKDRHWDEALAELAKLPADAAARAGRRARLPDRHDEVPHAPRLRRRPASCCWRAVPRLVG